MTSPIQIIGVPLDLGAGRRGTDAGVSALRIAGLKPALAELGFALLRDLDIETRDSDTLGPDQSNSKSDTKFLGEIVQVCGRLAECVKTTLAGGAFPLVLGGDHSVAMGTVTGIADHFRSKGEAIGLLWFDAHTDMNTSATTASGNIHGMPLAALLGYGDDALTGLGGFTQKVRAENTALVGVRSIDPRERELVEQSGIHVFTMRDIDELGMAEVARRALAIVNHGTAGFHLSFDVDGCDPEVIPGSGVLAPGGVSYREAHLLLEYCADSQKLLSLEVVELNPFLDQENISAERTKKFILSALGNRIK